jgi:hypothetical protein
MTKEKETQESSESVLVTADKTIGTAAGKIAVAVGVSPAPAKAAKKKAPPLAKKSKARLPRKQKKQARKVKSSA